MKINGYYNTNQRIRKRLDKYYSLTHMKFKSSSSQRYADAQELMRCHNIKTVSVSYEATIMLLVIILLLLSENFSHSELKMVFRKHEVNGNMRKDHFATPGKSSQDNVQFEKFTHFSNDRYNDLKDGNSNRDLLPKEKCGLDVLRRIIGGSTTDIDEFPWLCLLQYVNPSGMVSQDCSGVLISKRYVLTAAHCTNGLQITTKKLSLQKVKLGEWDTSTDKDCQGEVCSSPVQEIEIEEIIPHGKYESQEKSQANDIALIRLKKEANLNQFVQPICLPFDNIGNTNYEGKKLTVSGWGRTSNARDSSSNIKMKVDLPVTSWEVCRKFYDSFYAGLKISTSQFCAGGEKGKDSCQGDSGGPLMSAERTQNEIKWFVIGIVSSGPAACAVADRPSLYTNVSQYTDWILNNIRG